MTWYPNNLASMLKGKNNRNKLLFLLDGVIINGAYFITSGMILSGFAIFLGADDFITALLNNCANYAMVFSLVSFIIFENRQKRKRLLLTLNFISRLLMFVTALLPLVFKDNNLSLGILFPLAVISEVLFGIYRVGWVVWMMSVIPKDIKSDFIYLRTFLLRLFMSLISVASGVIIDMFNKGYAGFLIIFTSSFVLSILDIIILNNIEEPEYETSSETNISLRAFFQPVLNKVYRKYLTFVFVFYLGFTMASSFTPTYLIRYLNFDYKLISTMSVITSGVIVVSSLYWVRIEKAKGFKFTLCVSAFFSACELLLLAFVTRNTWPLLFLSSAFAGFGTGGLGNSIFTYRYEIMPETEKTIYESWSYLALALSMLAAPFLGKLVIDFIPDFSNSIFTNSKIQLLYFISFTLICSYLITVFKKPASGSKLEGDVKTL